MVKEKPMKRKWLSIIVLVGTFLAMSLTPSSALDLYTGSLPQLLPIPGTGAYYAPSVPMNYFAYNGAYYIYNGGTWFYSGYHNGQWVQVGQWQIPYSVLSIPLPYYRNPPFDWRIRNKPLWQFQR